MRFTLATSLAVPLGAAAMLLSSCGSSTPLLTTSSSTTTSSSSTSAPTTATSTSSSSSLSSSSLSASHDPCQLLTAADITGVLGGNFTKATGSSNVCGYAELTSQTAVAISTANLPTGAGAAAAAAAVRAAAGTAGGTVTTIDGTGDAAAGSSANGKTLVAFVKGGALVVVVLQGTSVTDPQNKAKELAQAVAAKL